MNAHPENQLIEQKVIELITLALEVEPNTIQIHSSMDNTHQWDSMGNLKILVEVENYLQCQFELDELINIRTVKDWINLATGRWPKI